MYFKVCEFIKPNNEMCGNYIHDDKCYCREHSFGYHCSYTCCLPLRQISVYVMYICETLFITHSYRSFS